MTLISLIIVLLAERIATLHRLWQADFYTSGFFKQLEKRQLLAQQSASLYYLLAIGLVTLLLFALLQAIDNAFIRLIIDTSILMVCIGCPGIRATYKRYLQAANRGDFEACSLYAEQLGHEQGADASFGQNLVWLNYQYYAAVIIWFAVLGPVGAVLYTLSRAGQHWLHQQQHAGRNSADKLMAILDFIPVRVTALGFLLVGHFSRALPIWLSHFANPHIPARQLLCDVSRAAEEVEPDSDDCTAEPAILVRLAKRNIMFLVVIISILSLSGWLP